MVLGLGDGAGGGAYIAKKKTTYTAVRYRYAGDLRSGSFSCASCCYANAALTKQMANATLPKAILTVILTFGLFISRNCSSPWIFFFFFCEMYGRNVMSARVLKVSLLVVGTLPRLERDARSMAK